MAPRSAEGTGPHELGDTVLGIDGRIKCAGQLKYADHEPVCSSRRRRNVSAVLDPGAEVLGVVIVIDDDQ